MNHGSPDYSSAPTARAAELLLMQDKLCFCIWDHNKSLTIFSDGWIHHSGEIMAVKTILQMLDIEYSMS